MDRADVEIHTLIWLDDVIQNCPNMSSSKWAGHLKDHISHDTLTEKASLYAFDHLPHLVQAMISISGAECLVSSPTCFDRLTMLLAVYPKRTLVARQAFRAALKYFPDAVEKHCEFYSEFIGNTEFLFSVMQKVRLPQDFEATERILNSWKNYLSIISPELYDNYGLVSTIRYPDRESILPENLNSFDRIMDLLQALPSRFHLVSKSQGEEWG